MTSEERRQRRINRQLRRRLIRHRKRGHQAPKLTRAYARGKARLATIIRRNRHPIVVSRSAWGAARPRGSYTAQPSIGGDVLHHTADAAAAINTPGEEKAYMRRIQQGHFARGFIDVGYGAVAFPSGRIYLGRPFSVVGAHTLNNNTGKAGFALAGNFEHETPTAAALRAIPQIRRLIAAVPQARRERPLTGHRDHNPTACPGRNLYPYTRQH